MRSICRLVLFWMAVFSDGLLSLRDAPRAWPPQRGNVARAPPGASGTHRVPLPPRIAASAKMYIKDVYKDFTRGRAEQSEESRKCERKISPTRDVLPRLEQHARA